MYIFQPVKQGPVSLCHRSSFLNTKYLSLRANLLSKSFSETVPSFPFLSGDSTWVPAVYHLSCCRNTGRRRTESSLTLLIHLLSRHMIEAICQSSRYNCFQAHPRWARRPDHPSFSVLLRENAVTVSSILLLGFTFCIILNSQGRKYKGHLALTLSSRHPPFLFSSHQVPIPAEWLRSD